MRLLVLSVWRSQTGAQKNSIIVPFSCGPHRCLTHQWVCLYTSGQLLTHFFSTVALLKDFIHTRVSLWCVKINSPFPNEWSKDNYSGSDRCWIDTHTQTEHCSLEHREDRPQKKKKKKASICLLLHSRLGNWFPLINASAIFRIGHFHLSSNWSSLADGVGWKGPEREKRHIC